MAIHDIMNKESIWKLLARKMTGKATEEELKELRDLLKSDPAMNYIAETFSKLWNRHCDREEQSGTSLRCEG